MDEAEVERVATLMHAAFNEMDAKRHPDKTHVAFASLGERTKADYRHVACAVLADLLCAPVVVAAQPPKGRPMKLGDRVQVRAANAPDAAEDRLRLDAEICTVLTSDPTTGLVAILATRALADRIFIVPSCQLAPATDKE